MIDIVIVIVFSAWCGILTLLVVENRGEKPKSGNSGPVIIKNFIRDRFGNIIKKDKREPRRGDDLAAYMAEQEAGDN